MENESNQINIKEENQTKNIKKEKRIIIYTTAIISCVITAIISMICYFCLKPKMTIVFYNIEPIQEELVPDYYEEYVCAYFRLNSEYNLILNVNDFSIDTKGEWKKAFKVEYFNQSIRTTFETYPNQSFLKVYFNTTYADTGIVQFVKYKDTKMTIGNFAYAK